MVYNDGDFEDLSAQEVIELSCAEEIIPDIKLACQRHANMLRNEGKIFFSFEYISKLAKQL